MKKLLYLLSLSTLISIPLIKADNKYSFTLHNCDYKRGNSLDWKFTQAGQTTEGTHDNGHDVPTGEPSAKISPTVMPASTKEWQYPPTFRYDSMKFSTSVNARWFDSTSTEEQYQVPANGDTLHDTLYVQLIDNNYTTSIIGCPAVMILHQPVVEIHWLKNTNLNQLKKVIQKQKKQEILEPNYSKI